MSERIVQTSQNVTLAGAGPVNKGIIDVALTRAPFLVAVDGGAELLRNYGKEPRAIIGDMDSVSPDFLDTLPPEMIHQVAEQESTDFDKALTRVRAPMIIGVGFLGGRVDHTLSAINSTGRNQTQTIVFISSQDVVFRLPHAFAGTAPVGCRLSLFPVRDAQVSTRGLRWDLDEALLSTQGQLSQSNEILAGGFSIKTEGDVVAVFPITELDWILEALEP